MSNMITKAVDRWFRMASVIGPDPSISPVTARNAIAPTEWFVNAQEGSTTADGRDPRSPLKTIQGALNKCKSGDNIYIVGNFTEEAVDPFTATNRLFDISIIGLSNRPRHADNARDDIGETSGVSWRPPSSPTAATPLLKIRGQGWHIENILFDCPVDAAAIELERDAGSGSAEKDASHFTVKGCRFASGQSGIEDDGGCFNVLVENCIFHLLTDGIKTLNTAIAVPLSWTVRNNKFFNNTHHIRVSAVDWVIRDNTFGRFTTTGINLTFVAGNDAAELANVITRNLLSGTYSAAGGYIEGGGNTDEWGGNFNSITGGVTAAQPG